MEMEHLVISHHHVQELQQRSPDLREVEQLIPRTKGDKQVDMNRALGRLPRLKRVSILLDCSNFTSQQSDLSDTSDPGDHDKQTTYLGGHTTISCNHIRNAFINTSIDSSLALSIFRSISTTNTLTHPTKHPSFQYLKLQAQGPGNFSQGWHNVDLENIVPSLGRCGARDL